MIGKQNLKFIPQNVFRYLRIRTGSLRDNTLHNLILIKLIINRFVDTVFLIRYSNHYTK
jgi:hypothetical protein